MGRPAEDISELCLERGEGGVVLTLQGQFSYLYERKRDNQVFYVRPVESTGTISYSMRQHVGDFVGAAFNTRDGDGSRWWYINTWGLGP